MARKKSKKFRKELKKQFRLAIAAAIGFSIAFAWRNVVFNLTREALQETISFLGAEATDVLSALLITLIGVLLIILTSRLLE